MLIGWDFDARIELSEERLPGRARHPGRFRALAGKAQSRPRGLPAALEHRRAARAVPRHHHLHADAVDGPSAHPHATRRRLDAGRLAPSQDRRDRRLPGLLRRHRHDQQPLGYARASRRRPAPHRARWRPLRTLARRDLDPGGCRWAQALGELSRKRWQAAGGHALEPVECGIDCWPEGVEAQFRRRLGVDQPGRGPKETMAARRCTKSRRRIWR